MAGVKKQPIETAAKAMAAEMTNRVDLAEKEARLHIDKEVQNATKRLESRITRAIIAMSSIIIIVMMSGMLTTYFTAKAKINEELISLQKELIGAYKDIREAKSTIQTELSTAKQQVLSLVKETETDHAQARTRAAEIQEIKQKSEGHLDEVKSAAEMISQIRTRVIDLVRQIEGLANNTKEQLRKPPKVDAN